MQMGMQWVYITIENKNIININERGCANWVRTLFFASLLYPLPASVIAWKISFNTPEKPPIPLQNPPKAARKLYLQPRDVYLQPRDVHL